MHLVAVFHQGLQDLGFVEGQNLNIEPHGDYSRPPGLIAELVARRVDVVAVGGGVAACAAKAATSTIPIVFATGIDPLEDGLIESFNRPGGNATGYTRPTGLSRSGWTFARAGTQCGSIWNAPKSERCSFCTQTVEGA